MADGICVDCDCRDGESGAIDVRERTIAGYTAVRCAECAIYTCEAADEDAVEYAAWRE